MDLITFNSKGVPLTAAWHKPANDSLRGSAGSPCVVMAHGLGGVRAARLDAFAERFAAAGLNVLVFDYRGFGESAGEPRQAFSIRGQLDDWAAAISHARKLPNVDRNRIALWGSSFSGGHVIVAAAEDGEIAAVSAQGPMMDGRAAFLNVIGYAGLPYALRIAGHAMRDVIGSVFGRRHRIPIISAPGQLGSLSSADAVPGYGAIAPPDWRNEITAGWMLQLPLYRPVSKAAQLHCPTLICICTRDSVAPPSAAEATARRIGKKAEVKHYDIGHFDVYVGEAFEQAVRDQTEFFVKVLRPY